MRPQEIVLPSEPKKLLGGHVWLKSVLIDAGNPFPTKIYRPRPTRRMSATRRLEKLHPHASDPRTAAIMNGKVDVGGDGRDTRKIKSYNLAYRLAWEHISEHQKREHQDILRRLDESIKRQVNEGATEPVFIASEALRDIEKS